MLETSQHGLTAVSRTDPAVSWMLSQLGGRAGRRDVDEVPHTMLEGPCVLQLGLLP